MIVSPEVSKYMSEKGKSGYKKKVLMYGEKEVRRQLSEASKKGIEVRKSIQHERKVRQ